jgi:hypothetical protein
MRTTATTCIMIENSPNARPQSGLTAASIIFEAIAEGGITRFLTVFQNSDAALIGPVRSIRPYYVEWLTPFDCSIAHAGGSDEALAMVRNNPTYRDIDEFSNGPTYWRSTDRTAPHNLYTSFENLNALNQTKGYLESTPTAFPRHKSTPQRSENAPLITQINLKISNALYNPAYTYDETTNTYSRAYQNGSLHLDTDATGTQTQVSPAVVIAMLVSEFRAGDGHENITTTGTGKAYIFQNGTATEAQWQKLSRDQQIEFFDTTGTPITLIPGQTWITAIPKSTGTVSYQ